MQLEFRRDEGGCWLPVGRTPRKDGRVRIRLNGKAEYLYRAVYRWIHRPIPVGKLLDHLCGNPMCCEPTHLEATTQKVNARRAIGVLSDEGVCTLHGPEHMTLHRNKAVKSGQAARCKACYREWSRRRPE